MRVLRIASIVGASLIAGGCTQAIASGTETATDDNEAEDLTSTASVPATATTLLPTADETTTSTPATSTSSTSTSSTTTTTTEPPLELYDPACVVQVQPGDSLGAIVATRADEIVTIASVRAENGLPDELIVPDQLLDVCIDNGLDDISGEQRLERNAAVVEAETLVAVTAQQAKLNELLVPYGFPEMPVDGISGPVTRRGLCAARLALGFPVNRADMEPGSVEEQFLLATTTLPIPPGVATDGRWIFIDLTCQVLLTGEGFDRLVHVFPTSTGEAGFETRLQERSRAFRYNPALATAGWHNSSTYPVEADNPLNGNMYRPLYFDRGQAIHGANNVPTSPQSKGCARLRPSHQDALIGWLGLDGLDGPTGSRDRINATVTVRGAYDLG
ncbi:MAG TPA: L,D-transpeptidase [Ilumatobacteraceae bacterium]|nr:L,D-transpeptidase [Ilumatobacteraceae bacterium]